MEPKIDTFISRIVCQNTKIVLVAKMVIVYMTLVHSMHVQIVFIYEIQAHVPILKVPGTKCRNVSFHYENLYLS